MADPINILSNKDIDTLRSMAREYRQRKGKGASRNFPEDTFWPPEMYVALTPSGGIPGVSEPRALTGTGWTQPTSSIQTGTGRGNEGDEPGSADCQIFRMTEIHGRKVMVPAGFSMTVYNLNSTAINRDQFVTVFRDKFGDWYVPNLGYLFGHC